MVRWLVALFWIALTVGPAVADGGANLIGTWRLSGGEVEFQDSGERRPPYGARSSGLNHLHARGPNDGDHRGRWTQGAPDR